MATPAAGTGVDDYQHRHCHFRRRVFRGPIEAHRLRRSLIVSAIGILVGLSGAARRRSSICFCAFTISRPARLPSRTRTFVTSHKQACDKTSGSSRRSSPCCIAPSGVISIMAGLTPRRKISNRRRLPLKLKISSPISRTNRAEAAKTPLSENAASNWPAAQRQCVTIARVLLKNAPTQRWIGNSKQPFRKTCPAPAGQDDDRPRPSTVNPRRPRLDRGRRIYDRRHFHARLCTQPDRLYDAGDSSSTTS